MDLVFAVDTRLNYHIVLFLAAKAGKRPKTVENYRSVLHLFREFNGPLAWPVRADHIDAFINDCQARGLSETTVLDYYHVLKVWLNWLAGRGKIETNPIELAEKPPIPKPLPRAPRQNDLRRLFGHLEKQARKGKGHWLDVRSLALWSLALDTGLRIGELMTLILEDVTIRKKQRSVFVKGSKTHRDRVVVVCKQTAKELKYWLKIRAGLPLPLGLDSLFVCYDKGKWKGFTGWGARQELSRRCAKIGLPHITPHQFRNAYAVFAIRNRQNLLDVQKQMGHSSISVTNRYTMVADDPERVKRHQKRSPRKKL